MIIVAMSTIMMSCNDSYPDKKESNRLQITGMIISKPLAYNNYLGYKLAIDENRDGLFDEDIEKYVWMPNDLYNEIVRQDSIIIKAIDCSKGFGNKFIVFDWWQSQDTSKTIKHKEDKK